MAKPYEKLTKTELIALCARLHKRVVRAEDKVAKLEAEITQLGRLADQWDSSHEQACADFGVVHITQEPAHVTQPLPRNKMPWETNE